MVSATTGGKDGGGGKDRAPAARLQGSQPAPPRLVLSEVWLTPEIQAAVWAKVNKDPSNPHMLNGVGGWIWEGLLTKNGYGYYVHPTTGAILGAHRLIYLYSGLMIPEAHDLDHLCRVRACVQPIHLEPVTHAENLRRRDNARPLAKRMPKPKPSSNSGLRSAFSPRRRRR